MISKWKLLRELDRAGQILQAWAAYPFENLIKRSHDLAFDEKTDVQTLGAPEPDGKFAILMVYQPKDFAQSIWETCEYLRSHNYQVIIVSNTPVMSSDLEKAKTLCWAIMQRPNYGYDFGAYRDGLLWLKRQGLAPQKLILMNDSFWFPVFKDCTFLTECDADTADLTGAIFHNVSKRKHKGTGSRGPFTESYFHIFSAQVLNSQAFWDYWQNYRVSSIKYNAVHRGERKLASAIMDGGLTVSDRFSQPNLIDALADSDALFLKKALEYGSFTETEHRIARDRLLDKFSETQDWCAETLSFIKTVTTKRGFHASFYWASYHTLGIPFLKKGHGAIGNRVFDKNGNEIKTDLQTLMREKFLQAAAAGDLPPILPGTFAEVQSKNNAYQVAKTVVTP